MLYFGLILAALAIALLVRSSLGAAANASNVVHITGTMRLRADREAVAQSLEALADGLAGIVDARKKRREAARDYGANITTSQKFEREIGHLLKDLGAHLDGASATFCRSSAPHGSPKMYVDAYATLLDDLLSDVDRARALGAPRGWSQGRAFCDLALSLYDQIAAWPETLRNAARSQNGSVRIVLDARYDTSANIAAARHDAMLIG